MYPRIRAAGVFWNIIAPAVVNGQLTDSCVAAKISGPRDGRSTLSIYMNDFTDFEKIVALERAIRALKFKCDMRFKSDIHSQLAIYGPTCHDFNVRDSPSSSWGRIGLRYPNSLLINSSPAGQNGCHFTDDIFRCIFMNEIFIFWSQLPCRLFLRVQLTITKHWFRCRIGVKPLSEPMLTQSTDADM